MNNIKVIEVKLSELAQDTKYIKYYAKYIKKHGYKQSIEELSHANHSELAIGALLAYACIDVAIGQRFKLILKDAPEENCYLTGVKISKYSLNIDVNSLKELFYNEDDDEEEFNNIIQSSISRTLGEDEYFSHPLVEVETVNGQQVVNAYGAVVLALNAILHPNNVEDNGYKAKNMIRRCLLECNSSLDIETLIQKVEARDYRTLLNVTTLAVEGFKNIFERQK